MNDLILTIRQQSSLRIYVWLILLNAPLLETDSYLSLIHRGASPAYSKIRNDTFRTLATDPLFRRRVSEASLIRLLNAVAWKLSDLKEERRETAATAGNKVTHAANAEGSPELTLMASNMNSRARALTLTTEGSDAGTSEPGIYVQGMNVLAAPFLYAARSEAEAFVAFYRFITTECPGYVRGAMDGVHKGLALVDKVLSIVDPKLSFYLIGKGMHAELYAFPSVLTLCACTPPLPEVLRLWDFLFAYGAHLNILCIVAQLVILRNSILSSPRYVIIISQSRHHTGQLTLFRSPTKILRSFPPLQAEMIKEVTLTLIKKVPDDVYADIVAHAK
jgi:cell cycle arrest protein BUB2